MYIEFHFGNSKFVQKKHVVDIKDVVTPKISSLLQIYLVWSSVDPPALIGNLCRMHTAD